MEQKKMEEVIKGVIQKRINLLASIISGKADDAVTVFAAIQLAFIGTRESSDALMDLIEQRGNPSAQDMMIMALLFCSPFRNEYKERLMQIGEDPEDIKEAFADMMEGLVNLSGQPPLWQEVAKALEEESGAR